MEKTVKEIRENFLKYEKLLGEEKSSSVKTITLDEIRTNHKNTRTKKINITHNSIPDKIELIIESKIANKKDFKFKLRAPEYTGIPFF